MIWFNGHLCCGHILHGLVGRFIAGITGVVGFSPSQVGFREKNGRENLKQQFWVMEINFPNPKTRLTKNGGFFLQKRHLQGYPTKTISYYFKVRFPHDSENTTNPSEFFWRELNGPESGETGDSCAWQLSKVGIVDLREDQYFWRSKR